MERVTVYVDGFNLYYGLRRMRAVDADWQKFYWLDFVKFFEHFKDRSQILQKVVYFTTPPQNIQKSNRQAKLLDVNKLLNENRFEVIYGKFIDKWLICPKCKSKYKKPEEKRTDVNISVQMMNDCALDNTDVIVNYRRQRPYAAIRNHQGKPPKQKNKNFIPAKSIFKRLK